MTQAVCSCLRQIFCSALQRHWKGIVEVTANQSGDEPALQVCFHLSDRLARTHAIPFDAHSCLHIATPSVCLQMSQRLWSIQMFSFLKSAAWGDLDRCVKEMKERNIPMDTFAYRHIMQSWCLRVEPLK